MSNVNNSDNTDKIATVQVALRIRPLSAEELVNVPSRLQKNAITTSPFTPNQVVVQGEKKKSFTFDHVFGPKTAQKEIYDKTVKNLVDQFLEGNDVNLLTFGHKSSGKTYTIGTNNTSLVQESKGIIPRSMDKLFSCVNSTQYKSRKFSVKISFAEIYNDGIIDLLYEGGDNKTNNSNSASTGLQEIKVNSAEEVMGLLSLGQLRRINAQEMNQNDVNSHVIVIVTLSQQKFIPTNETSSPSYTPPTTPNKAFSPKITREKSKDDNKQFEGDWVMMTSKFHFVDLAGNEMEKGNFGLEDKLKEHFSSTNENMTRVAIGNAIYALENQSQNPTILSYKDNKLTKILRNYLANNSQTLIIACVTPAEYNIKETINTFEYAKYARNIKYTSSYKTIQIINYEEEENWNDLKHLQSLVLKLRSEIIDLKNDSESGSISPSTTLSNNNASLSLPNNEDKFIILKRSFNDLSKEFAKSKVLKPETTIPEEENSENGTITEEDTDSATLVQDDNNESKLNNIQNVWPSFQKAVGPVIQEYEKSITSLENQLSLVRAALSHSESRMHAQERKLSESEENNGKNMSAISDLKHTISKLNERGETTENYIKDLEAKLDSDTHDREKDQIIIHDLKDRIEELSKNSKNSGSNKNINDDKEKKLLEEIKTRDYRISQLEENYENLVKESNRSKTSSASSADSHFFTSSLSSKFSSMSSIESNDLITSLQEKLFDIQTQYEDTKDSNKEQFETIKKLEMKLSEANDALTQKEDKLMKQDSQISELKASMQKSNLELQKVKTSEVNETEMEIVKGTVEKQSAHIKELEELLSEAQQVVKTDNKAELERIKELEAKLEEKDVNEIELQQFVEMSDAEVVKLQQLVNELESKLQNVENKRKNEISKLDVANKEIESLKSNCTQLQQQIKKAQKTASREIKVRDPKLENTITQQNDLIKNLEEQIVELERQLDESSKNTSVNTHKDSSGLLAEIQKLNKKLSKVESENLNLKNQQLVNENDANPQNAKEQLDSALSQNQELQKHITELKSVLDEARNEIESTKSAKEKAEKAKIALEGRIERLMAKKNKIMCF